MDANSDDEHLRREQRFKAAVHYTVGKVCTELETEELRCSRRFIATLAETTYRYSELLAKDLSHFAKHAKRTTVNADDVKLAVRKSTTLQAFLQEKHDALTTLGEERRARDRPASKKTGVDQKGKSSKKVAEPPADEGSRQDDSS